VNCLVDTQLLLVLKNGSKNHFAGKIGNGIAPSERTRIAFSERAASRADKFSPSGRTHMTPARILVVDDNTADVRLLRVGLDRQGEEYMLEVLEDGEEALRFVKNHRGGSLEPEPCVILLDLHLPRYDGIAILEAIRQAPVLAHIHVVILSGTATPREKDQIAKMDAVYRLKPFSLNEYYDLAAEIFAICQSATAVAA
jgi:CheY-like chemotaxis protein